MIVFRLKGEEKITQPHGNWEQIALSGTFKAFYNRTAAFEFVSNNQMIEVGNADNVIQTILLQTGELHGSYSA